RRSPGDSASAEPIVTVHDQAAARSVIASRVVEPRSRKPWLWIGVGAAAVLALVLIIKPQLLGIGDDEQPQANADADAPKQPEPTTLPSAGETGEGPTPQEASEAGET